MLYIGTLSFRIILTERTFANAWALSGASISAWTFSARLRLGNIPTGLSAEGLGTLDEA